MNKICFHAVIYGKVQGVFYRAHAQQKAHALGLTGWVKNRPDGTVEVIACGTKENLTIFQAWLKKGPPHASVTEAQIEEIPHTALEGFIIR